MTHQLPTVFVSLCCGAGAEPLEALRQAARVPTLDPPVAWMGGKRRLAPDILGVLGVEPALLTRIVLVDAGTWGWVWPVCLGEHGPRVCEVLRLWGSERGPRALWDWLVSQPPMEGLAERAAQWLWLQARSASGVPVWWSADLEEWKKGDGDRSADDRGEDRRWPYHDLEGWRSQAGPRADGSRGEAKASMSGGKGWRQGSANARPDQPAEQRGLWLASDGRGVERPCGQRQIRSEGGKSGGMMRPATIAERIEAIRRAILRWGGSFEVVHGDVRDFEPISGSIVAFDPPYLGRTGYGWTLDRPGALDVARRHRAAECRVGVCEAEPLDLSGWFPVELARGQKSPEWITVSHPPARVQRRHRQIEWMGAAR